MRGVSWTLSCALAGGAKSLASGRFFRLALTSGLTTRLQPANTVPVLRPLFSVLCFLSPVLRSPLSVPLFRSAFPVPCPPTRGPWPKAAVRPGGGRLGCAEMARRVRQHGTVERSGATKYGRAPDATCSPHHWLKPHSERASDDCGANTGADPKVGDVACAYNQGWLLSGARPEGSAASTCRFFCRRS